MTVYRVIPEQLHLASLVHFLYSQGCRSLCPLTASVKFTEVTCDDNTKDFFPSIIVLVLKTHISINILVALSTQIFTVSLFLFLSPFLGALSRSSLPVVLLFITLMIVLKMIS